MLCFAFGSNLSWTQMEGRCPSARFAGVAKLPDHGLAFTRWSDGWGGGVADAVQAEGSAVWGVVYELSEPDVEALDRREGYRVGRADGNAYWRRQCTVLLDGDDGRPLAVEAYFAEPDGGRHLPSRAYMDRILEGARHWRLPPDYIAELEAIEVASQADGRR